MLRSGGRTLISVSGRMINRPYSTSLMLLTSAKVIIKFEYTMIKNPHPRFAAKMGSKKTQINGKQSFRAVLCTLIYISTFVPNLNFGQDEHKRRRQVLCLNGSQIPKFFINFAP